LVQTEFKVGTTDAEISAQLEKQQEANMKKVDKLKKKRDKLDKQIENLGGK
jgi:chaperonin cofactor prefoldin